MIQKIRLNKSSMIGAGAIMLAALLWSLDGVFIRPKFYIYSASLIVFLEHFLGFVVLSPFIILSWSKIKTLRWKDWGAVLWVSVFGGLLGTLMITEAFFAAVHGEVTYATVVILQKLQPIFALLLARIVLKEKLNKKFYFWAILAVVSAYFLAFGKTGLDLGSIDWFHNAAIFAVLAAFSFGSSTVFGKRIVNHLNFKATTALRFAVTAFLALTLILFNHDIVQVVQLEKISWLYLLVIVFSSGAVAMFIYYFGLKRITASTATICELFWPLSAVILDYIINRNFLNTIQIIASLALLLAFYKVVKIGQTRKIEFEARKVKGKGRGTRLGFPTINLENVDLDIDYGVYVVKVFFDGQEIKALMHFGRKETFNEKSSIEFYIQDNLIIKDNEKFKVEVIKKIRDIKKFNNTEELQKQIKFDKEFLTKE